MASSQPTATRMILAIRPPSPPSSPPPQHTQQPCECAHGCQHLATAQYQEGENVVWLCEDCDANTADGNCFCRCDGCLRQATQRQCQCAWGCNHAAVAQYQRNDTVVLLCRDCDASTGDGRCFCECDGCAPPPAPPQPQPHHHRPRGPWFYRDDPIHPLGWEWYGEVLTRNQRVALLQSQARRGTFLRAPYPPTFPEIVAKCGLR